MSLFDSINSEAQEKFSVGGDKANSLLTTLLSAILDKENGGFTGFLKLFDDAGLGDTAASWITTGTNTTLSYEQTESVFGEQALKDISAETGIEYEKATEATAFMVPHIVDKLTPEGEIPDEASLLATVSGVSGFTGIGASELAEPDDKFMDAAEAVAEGDADDNTSLLKILIPLILLAILLFFLYLSCGGPPKQQTPTRKNPVTEANAETAGGDKTGSETTESSFTLKAENGKYIASGVVPDEATLKQIKDALTAQFGEGNVDFSGLRVDANAKPFAESWWGSFSKLLPDLKDWKTGTIAFTGSALTTAADLPETAITNIKMLFGEGWTLPVSIEGEEVAAKRANEEAVKKLEEAKSVEEVVTALNASIINFASGSSEIPADAKPVLDKAAEVLKAQPANTNIEIGGYTDSDGADDANQKLSEARATSVKNELVRLGVAEAMLTAKGYGEANPVAENDTPDNKFKNRRIEYKVVSGDGSMTKTETTNTEEKPADTDAEN